MITINCNLKDKQPDGHSQIDATQENWEPLKKPLLVKRGEEISVDVVVQNLQNSAFAKDGYLFYTVENEKEDKRTEQKLSNFGVNVLTLPKSGDYRVMFGIGCKEYKTEYFFASMRFKVSK